MTEPLPVFNMLQTNETPPMDAPVGSLWVHATGVWTKTSAVVIRGDKIDTMEFMAETEPEIKNDAIEIPGEVKLRKAKKLRDKDVRRMVDELDVPIAKAKGRSLRLGYDYIDNPQLWITGAVNQTDDWKRAAKMLRKLGYKVSVTELHGLYGSGSFRLVFTLIEW
jgi:hypothetical protein